MIHFAHIAIGTDHGVCCARCAPAAHEPTFRSAKEITHDIDRACAVWEQPPGPNILLAGAEPFRHPQLPALVVAARSAGAQRVGLRTDGVALAHGDNAHGSVSAGVRLYEFMVVGGEASSHDRITERPGSFVSALSGLSRVREAAQSSGVEVALRGRIPVCAHNLLEVPAACGALARGGCATVRLECSAVLDARKALPWLIAGAETGMVNGTWVVIAGVESGLLGSHALHATDPIQVEGAF